MSRKKNKRKLIAEINVVPYVDVTLVLLIVFMVSAPLLMQGVDVDLPQAPSAPLEENANEPLIISIKEDGSLYLNLGASPNESIRPELLQQRIAKVIKQRSTTPVLIWGDKNIPYGKVVGVMTLIQSTGARSVGLVTEMP
tara:strand:+ start:3276 stop:3695 length:420 start_codon:yes stop_codon:yes gene_type:complete